MLAIGILYILMLISGFVLAFINDEFRQYSISQIVGSLFLGGPLFVAFLYVIFSSFLRKGNGWAWYASMVLLLKYAVVAILFLFQSLQTITLFKEILSIAQPNQLFFYIIYAIIFPAVIYTLVFWALILLLREKKNYFYKNVSN